MKVLIIITDIILSTYYITTRLGMKRQGVVELIV